MDQHRAGINLTTHCLLPTAGAYYMLPTACCLPLLPTTAYYALPTTYYHYSAGAMRYLLRVLLASSASEARVTLIRAELSWSTLSTMRGAIGERMGGKRFVERRRRFAMEAEASS